MVNLVQGWQADPVLQDALKRAGSASMLDLHRITRVVGKDRVTGVAVEALSTAMETEILSDGVFVEIGLSPNTAPLKGLAELSPVGELVIDSHCRTSVEGLFGAGDATTVPYNQIVISAGEGAKAALAAYDYLLKKGLI
jgi:alkyl hydroperoxide reductase subunit F